MIVLAIDPGYDRLGIAVLEKKDNKETLIYSECFETPKELFFSERLGLLGLRIREIINLYQPKFLAIEDLFFSKNTKTALKVSEARGAIIFLAIDAGLLVCEYTPNQIKVAVTGYGRATKKDVHLMVDKLISMNAGDIKKDDEIDAIATGLTFFASYRGPLT